MQISQGNFGNSVAQLTPQNTSNPELLSGVQAREKAAAQQGQAGMALGQAVQSIGDVFHQHFVDLARQKAQLQLQDKQTFQAGVLDGVRQRVASGQISAKDIDAEYKKGMEGWKPEPIQDMNGSTQFALSKGNEVMDRQGQQHIGNLVAQQVHVEWVQNSDGIVAGKVNNAVASGKDIPGLQTDINDYFDQPSVKAGYGASWEAKRGAAVKSAVNNKLSHDIETNRDSNAALNGMRDSLNMIEDGHLRNALLTRLDDHIAHNDAKSAAAQQHADAEANRRETAAASSMNSFMTAFVYTGNVPSPEAIQKLRTDTAGTSQAGAVNSMVQGAVYAQKVLALPADQQEAQVDAWELHARQNGGSPEQYAMIKTLRGVIEQNKTTQANDPVRGAEQRLGTTFKPLDVGNMDSAELDNRRAGVDAQKRDNPGAGAGLLRPSEVQGVKDAMGTMTPKQQIDYLANMREKVGDTNYDRITKQLYANDGMMMSVAGNSHTPEQRVNATAFVAGQKLLHPTDGSKPLVLDPQVVKSLTTQITDMYPNDTTAQRQQRITLATNAVAAGRIPADKVDDEDIVASVFGTPVKVQGLSGAQVVAPVGWNADSYRGTVSRGLDNISPNRTEVLSVKNHLANGTYKMLQSGDSIYIVNAANQPVALSTGRAIITVPKVNP